jgi:hypothetical protein
MNAKSGEPSISISLTTIYEKVCEGNKQTADALHRIELLTRDVGNMKLMQERLEADIESLKRSRWPMPSIAVVISFLSLVYIVLKDSLRGQ